MKSDCRHEFRCVYCDAHGPHDDSRERAFFAAGKVQALAPDGTAAPRHWENLHWVTIAGELLYCLCPHPKADHGETNALGERIQRR